MDIEKAQINFNCPDCEFINTAAISDFVNGASIICVGCLQTIQLGDSDGDTERGINEVEQAFNDLGKAFRRGH